MDRPFEILEHTADVGLRARGDTEAQACENAARGLMSLLSPSGEVRATEAREVVVEGTDAVDLLVRWLHELLFLFDTEGLLCAEARVIEFSPQRLRAHLRGERFDPARHEPGEEIKAVTYHGARFERSGAEWVAEVLFDI
jgi:SHS2 domain-containing protein